MRISDWSSDVCSSDLGGDQRAARRPLDRDGRDRAGVRAVQPAALRGEAGCSEDCVSLKARTGSPSSSTASRDRKSVVKGKSVSVRVNLGGRRVIKKKKKPNSTRSI